MLRKITSLASALSLVAASGCVRDVASIDVRPLPRRNPTTYEFPLSEEELRAAVRRVVAEYPNRTFPPYTILIDGRPFRQQAALSMSSEEWGGVVSVDPVVCDSLVYRGADRGLWYLAKFEVIFTAVEASRTRLEVRALNPMVVNGKRWAGGPCGVGWVSRSEPVEATTVEEYLLLLRIGREVDISMPAVVCPVDEHLPPWLRAK